MGDHRGMNQRSDIGSGAAGLSADPIGQVVGYAKRNPVSFDLRDHHAILFNGARIPRG